MSVVNIPPNLSRKLSKIRGWNILRANNPLHAGINHRKRTMRNTWHFFEGRQDQQDWHRPLPNTESVWPSNVQSRKLLFFPPLTRSALCGGAAPTPFYGLFTKRDIYKYFTTKNSFAPQMLSIPSRAASWQSISQRFLLSRHIRRLAATPTFASTRTHRSGNSRENHLCLSEFDFAFASCDESCYMFHTLVKILFKCR